MDARQSRAAAHFDRDGGVNRLYWIAPALKACRRKHQTPTNKTNPLFADAYRPCRSHKQSRDLWAVADT
eukprot:680149-Pyramimonas_sp.AAC.1